MYPKPAGLNLIQLLSSGVKKLHLKIPEQMMPCPFEKSLTIEYLKCEHQLRFKSLWDFLLSHSRTILKYLPLGGPSEIASTSYVSNQKGGVLGIVFN